MADRPIATAPLLSVAALSTMTTFSPFAFAQRHASNAAPHPAIPPPMIRRSHSTSVTSGFLQNENVHVSFSMYIHLLFFSCRSGKETGLFDCRKIRRRFPCIGIHRALCRCPDGELEPLEDPVS